MCVTRDPRGTVIVRTGAGAASADYDASVLQQPPSVTSVTPPFWSTANETFIVIAGDRCVRVFTAERFEFGCMGVHMSVVYLPMDRELCIGAIECL